MKISTSVLVAVGTDPMILTSFEDDSLGEVSIIFLDGAVKAGVISEAGAFISEELKGEEEQAIFDELWEPDPVVISQVLLDNLQNDITGGEHWLNIRLAVNGKKKGK